MRAAEPARHGHDGPPAMSVPLAILAVLAVIAGWGTAGYFTHAFGTDYGCPCGTFDRRADSRDPRLSRRHRRSVLPLPGEATDPIIIPLFRNKFYVDEFYARWSGWTHDLLAHSSPGSTNGFSTGSFVRGLSGATWGFGFVLRFFQFGNLQGYAFIFGAGVVALIYLMLFAR